MQTDFVYLIDDPPADRVEQLIATLIKNGFAPVSDGSMMLKITTTPSAVVTLTTFRERFDAEIDSYSDIIKRFPELNRR